MAERVLQLIAQRPGDIVVGGVAVAELDDVHRPPALAGLQGVQRVKEGRQAVGVADVGRAGLRPRAAGKHRDGEGHGQAEDPGAAHG